MDKKDGIFDEIEILDDFSETEADPEIVNNDWLSDFTDNTKEDNQLDIQFNEIDKMGNSLDAVQTTELNQEEVPKVEEEPTTEPINTDEAMINPELEAPVLNVNDEEKTEVLDNPELLNIEDPEAQQKTTENEELEKELNNNRSVFFIVGLFVVLIIFIILLPFVTEWLK
ncbi:MAG: hypothetical protein PHI05_00340 [Bacilli bacterium]|nr:hypothetical protein [Bacilli bacterium]MDD4547188.1 hypothetical protein [Bacilli bacterium]